MSTGITLILIGLIISFIGICFAAVNMFYGIGKTPSSRSENLFKGHLVCMIITAFGGLLFLIGIVLYSTEFLNKIVS